MRLKRTYDLEGLREDANMAIGTAKEDIVRPGADATQIILQGISDSSIVPEVGIGNEHRRPRDFLHRLVV